MGYCSNAKVSPSVLAIVRNPRFESRGVLCRRGLNIDHFSVGLFDRRDFPSAGLPTVPISGELFGGWTEGTMTLIIHLRGMGLGCTNKCRFILERHLGRFGYRYTRVEIQAVVKKRAKPWSTPITTYPWEAKATSKQ